MTDQEQAERGASTVSNRGYWISQASLDDIAEREVQLRADLERVTAERDAMREVVEAGQRLREAKEEIKRRGWSAHLQEADAYQAFFKALAHLDATRKATADAEEEGK